MRQCAYGLLAQSIKGYYRLFKGVVKALGVNNVISKTIVLSQCTLQCQELNYSQVEAKTNNLK